MVFFLWLMLACLCLLGAILALPVRVALRARSDPSLHYAVTARPLGGYGPRITLADSTRKDRKMAPDRKTGKKQRHTSRTRGNRGIFPAGLELISRLLGCIRFDRLDIEGQFGTGDPAETGQVFGLLAPLIYGSPHLARTRIEVQPVFDKACAAGVVDARFSVVPIALVPPFIRFGWIAFGPGR